MTLVKQEDSNYFVDLSRINVSNYVEKKGQFSYLSWSHAVDQMTRYDPTFTWKVLRFPMPGVPGVEVPYLNMGNGCMVEVEVTVKGRTLSQLQPVMDFKNKSMSNPDSMDVNKAIQRCLVKGIALHGLGLYIYSGEDLPNDIISGTQMKVLQELSEEFARMRGVTIENVYGALKIASINHLTIAAADMSIDTVKNWITQAKAEQARLAATQEKPVEPAQEEATEEAEPVNA